MIYHFNDIEFDDKTCQISVISDLFFVFDIMYYVCHIGIIDRYSLQLCVVFPYTVTVCIFCYVDLLYNTRKVLLIV